MKKFISMLLALTLVCTLLTGLSAQAADEAALTIYTQSGEYGPKTAVKSYTAEELKKLAETKEDGYGYQYFKNGWQATVATEYVTLDALLADAGVTFAEGGTLHFTCTDGEYTKFAPSYKDIAEGKYFFDGETSAEVPAAIAISWTNGALADGTVADLAKTSKDSGSLRFVCGTTEADYTSEKAAGKRMPSGVIAISVVTESVSYTDVADASWYHDAVTYCSDNGLFKGVGEGKFAPAQQMTMAELATVLYRVAGNTTDGSGEKWYSQPQAWTAEKEIIAADSFDAAANVDRAAFVTMFYKTLALDSKYDTKVTDEMRKAVEAATDYASINAADVDAIAWAVSVGLIKGTDGSTLTVNPAAQINRAEVCTMLQRYYTGLAK